jgi:hypothetical protein
MRMKAAAAAALVALCGGTGRAQDGKEAVSAANFQKLYSMIRPAPDKSFEAIPWSTSLWEARKKAAAEDKPIVLWAGDPHPLGVT